MESVWRKVLGVQHTVIEEVGFDENLNAVVVRVRPDARSWNANQCGVCRTVSPGYDRGEGGRLWRGLDLGPMRVFIEGDRPRVTCREHGVVAAAVPWARHRSGFTDAFEDTVAWLVTQASQTAVGELMRIVWRTVGRIIERVTADRDVPAERLRKLRRIGIDEVSFRKGHKYVVVVVDHDTRKLVWAHEGRDEATLRRFFDFLGPEGCARIEFVTADAASWIENVVREKCPQAKRCLDPFHVVSWVTDALDQVRRDVWNTARRSGQKGEANDLKGARWALWKNPEDLTARQKAKLADIARTNEPLYRAYLLKEQLREVFRLTGEAAKALLERWIGWALRCQLKPFVEAAKSIARHREAIQATLDYRLSNGLVESTNTKTRLIIRRAFGFHSPRALIALAMLCLGGLCPPLPGRR